MCAVSVDLTTDEGYAALRLALKSFRRNQRFLGYYQNRLENHLFGKLGEVGAEKWLRLGGFDPDPAYRNLRREAEPDLILDGIGIEVKSWRPSTWVDGGRCVRPDQMEAIKTKCAVIVWGIVDDKADPFTVELAGWSTPDEVARTDIRVTEVGKNKYENHQVDVDDLRAMDTLLDEIRDRLSRAPVTEP